MKVIMVASAEHSSAARINVSLQRAVHDSATCTCPVNAGVSSAITVGSPQLLTRLAFRGAEVTSASAG
jgi:hypothetical protein